MTYQKRILLLFCTLTFGVLFTSQANALGTCTGRFVNPITDVCWKCIFPISIGASTLGTSGGMVDTPNYPSPVCTCPRPPIPAVPGISIGFWEPARISEVVRTPYCFPTLGGLDLSSSFPSFAANGTHRKNDKQNHAFYHVHWYEYPLLSILGLLTDFGCGEKGGMDIDSITEIDPLWSDDELSFILNPEAALFANPVAQAACAADCIAATAHLPLDAMFWCAGCQGSMYPFTGTSPNHSGGVQDAALITERYTAKLFREGLAWLTSTPAAMCQAYPIGIILKSQYRAQLAYPIPSTVTGLMCCPPYGATDVVYGTGKEFPYKGEDFAFIIWRKRNCCLL